MLFVHKAEHFPFNAQQNIYEYHYLEGSVDPASTPGWISLYFFSVLYFPDSTFLGVCRCETNVEILYVFILYFLCPL